MATVEITGPVGPISGPVQVDIVFSEAVTGLTLEDLAVAGGTASELTGSGTEYAVTITPTASGAVSVDLPAGAASAAGTQDITWATGADLAATLDGRWSYETYAPGSQSGGWQYDAGGATGSAQTGPSPSNTLAFVHTETSGSPSSPEIQSERGILTMLGAEGSPGRPWLEGSGRRVFLTVCIQGDFGSESSDGEGEGLAVEHRAGDTDDWTTARLIRGWPYATTGRAYGDLVTDYGDNPFLVARDGGWRDVDIAIPDSARQLRLRPVYHWPPGSRIRQDVALRAVALQRAVDVPSEAASWSVTADIDAPTVAITGPAGPISGPVQVDIVFSEAVTRLTLVDLAVARGTASELTGSGAEYAVTITPTASGAVTVDLPAGAAVDGAGNASLAGSWSVTADIDAPTPSIAGVAGPITGPTGVIVAFREPVTGLTLEDIVVAGGTASNLIVISADIPPYDIRWTALITPAASGRVTVDIPAGAVTDRAGNRSLAAPQWSVEANLPPSAPAAGTVTAPAEAAGRWRRAARALAPTRTLLVAAEIAHPDAAAPVRVVNDTGEWRIEGNTYAPVRFGSRLADDAEGRPPRAEIWVDNVGHVLTSWIEDARGAAGATVRLLQISADLAAAPGAGIVEWEQSLSVRSVHVTRSRVVMRLGVPSLRGRAAVIARHDPSRSPGIF